MKWIKNICYSLLAIISITACTDEIFVENTDEPRVEEGIPMTIDLTFQVDKPVVQTRAAASVRAENTVHNLYIFAFNGDGSLDAKQFYDRNNNDWENTSQKVEEDGESTKGVIRNFAMHSGNNKTFYAVANVGYSGVTREMFDDVTSQEILLAKVSNLINAANIERTYFVMTGQVGVQKNGEWNYTYNISSGQQTLNGSLLLKRVDARITFNVIARNDNRYTEFSFVPKNYRVYNIPRATYLFEQANDAAGDYGVLPTALNFDVTEIGEGVTSTFEFYLQENRQTYKQRITEQAKLQFAENKNTTLFAMREKREMDKSDELDNRQFLFAPQYGTYVEIQGQLSYQKKEGSETQFISADVTYTVHLGNTGTTLDVNNEEKVNNYDTKRNTRYTYNVYITDINSIVVEVESDDHEESRPGAEGNVVIAGGEVLELDAHFDRYRFILWYDDLKNETSDGMLTWAVSTPFENAMRIKGGNMPKDYKWITFAINKEYNQDVDNRLVEWYVKYPGDNIYDGYGDVKPTEDGTYCKPHWDGYNIPSTNDGNVALRDVEQLLKFLGREAQDNPNSYLFEDLYDNETGTIRKGVAITAFIDEYVYIKDPTDDTDHSTPENPTPEGLLLWKRVTNGRDRLLHICRGEGVKSSDGASSVIRSVLSFRQHPIYTIYDINSDVTTAWGTESIMETEALKASFNHTHQEPYDNTADNGRINQMNFVTDTNEPKHWSSVISQNERYGLKTSDGIDYKTIWHACMLRNRDIDGDNEIDDNEVRWYLAAIDQLTDLWTGDASINEASRLYPTEQYGKRYHVASSTYWGGNSGNSANPTVIWAEEGGSIGSYSYSHDNGNPTGDNYAYRCVRNLGVRLDEPNKQINDYVRWDSENRIVDVSRLGYASKRSANDGGNELDEHTERDEVNRPYARFQVYTSQSYYQEHNSNVYYTWSQFHNKLYPSWGRSSSPCPEGYRVPNQREMGIMLTIPELKAEMSVGYQISTLVSTGFSMDDLELYKDKDRPGFAYRGWEGTFILVTENVSGTHADVGGTRCVRDVIE